MKLYTLATSLSTPSHGGNDNYECIVRSGSWQSGPWFPLFKTKQEAEKHIDDLEFGSFSFHVVELEVRENAALKAELKS